MAELTSAAAAAAPLPVPSAIERAEAFTRERFVHEGEDAATALAPGSARRRALDAALAELDRGAKAPSTRWRRRYALLLGLERLLSQDTPTLADGTTLNPHQVDALSGTLTALLAAAQNGHAETPAEASGPAPVLAVDEPADAEPDDADDDDLELDLDLDLDEEEEDEIAEAAGEPLGEDDLPSDEDDDAEDGRRRRGRRRGSRRRSQRPQALLVRARDRRRQDRRRDGLRRGLAHRRHPDPHPPPQPRRPVPRRARTTAATATRESPPLLEGDGTQRTDGPVTVETYQWFVRNAGRISDAYTIVICDEAHTALGEKTSRRHPRLDGPDLHRHDGDGRAHRAPRHRPLPDADVALRPRAGRAPRRHRAAALHPDPAGPGRADDRQGPAAQGRGRRRVRPGDAGRAAGPGAVQPGDRRPLQDALQRRARRRLRRGRQATRTTSPRPSAPSTSRPRPCRARRPSASSPRSWPATSAATSTSSSTRSCWPRAGTRRGRRSACTSRRRRRSASTSSASAA